VYAQAQRAARTRVNAPECAGITALKCWILWESCRESCALFPILAPPHLHRGNRGNFCLQNVGIRPAQYPAEVLSNMSQGFAGHLCSGCAAKSFITQQRQACAGSYCNNLSGRHHCTPFSMLVTCLLELQQLTASNYQAWSI
jgi:hypothetical protein